MPFINTPSRLRNIADRTLDMLLPPACLSCDKPVSADKTLCPDCWSKIHFIDKPYCACCGMPFEVPVEDGTLCAGCIASPSRFSAARASMLYDDASKNMILRFKHSDRTDIVKALAGWMHRSGEEFWANTDYIIPVPLHRTRLFQRRYNQAALLSQALAELSKKSYLPDTLVRLEDTASQGRMNRKERHENVMGAFGLKPGSQPFLRYKSILLVDDVLTTGATVNECSRVLLESGADKVNVLVLARVKGHL